MNTSLIYKLLSFALFALAGAFGLSVLVGLLRGESPEDRSLQAFFAAITVTLVLAGALSYLGKKGGKKFFRREALCAIGLSWLLSTLIGALPYLLAVEGCAVADAVFESASGLTTTGATAFSNFSEFPSSLLFWRSISQWIGGLGVVVFFVAVLSSLGAGAKVLFSSEFSGSATDFEQGQVQKGAFLLLLYYLALSAACASAYQLAGMDWFQAVNHAMTTVSTGGFGTEAGSFTHFANPRLEWIAVFFMIAGGTTFVFVLRLLRRQRPGLRQTAEVKGFLLLLAAGILIVVLHITDWGHGLPRHRDFREASFQVVSLMTTTGYNSADFDLWAPGAQMLLVLLMFIGGCSGSTSGGSKVVRILVAAQTAGRSVIHAIRPHVTRPVRLGSQGLGEQTVHSVVLFLMLFAGIQFLGMFVVALLEPALEFQAVFSSVQATLFNIGPGFGAVGPTQDYAFLKSPTKLFLALLMILGRLELYAVLVLFAPTSWKQFS